MGYALIWFAANNFCNVNNNGNVNTNGNNANNANGVCPRFP